MPLTFEPAIGRANCSHVPVPKALPKIAQRFNVGWGCGPKPVPTGTVEGPGEPRHHRLSRPIRDSLPFGDPTGGNAFRSRAPRCRIALARRWRHRRPRGVQSGRARRTSSSRGNPLGKGEGAVNPRVEGRGSVGLSRGQLAFGIVRVRSSAVGREEAQKTWKGGPLFFGGSATGSSSSPLPIVSIAFRR